jgi:hypothetical protein
MEIFYKLNIYKYGLDMYIRHHIKPAVVVFTYIMLIF